jgi:hypothetical protein
MSSQHQNPSNNKQQQTEKNIQQIEKKRQKKENKKQKMMYVKEGVTVADLRQNWTQCNYFIKKKKRLCNMQRAHESSYCPVHRSDVAAATAAIAATTATTATTALSCEKSISDSKTDDINPPDVITGTSKDTQMSSIGKVEEGSLIQEEHIRVPCPVDPSHSVYKHKLADHVKKCNTATRYQKLEQFVYYCKDCNTGQNPVEDCSSSSVIDPDELLKKVEALYEMIKDDIRPMKEEEMKGIILPEDSIVKNLSGDKSSYLKVRHAYQDVLLVKNMMLADLLSVTAPTDTNPTSTDDDDQQNVTTTFIELGAGKGLLGLAVASAQQGSLEETQAQTQLVMVERAGSKKTGDRMLDTIGFDRYLRIRMDLRDCMLSKLPGVFQGEFVFYFYV